MIFQKFLDLLRVDFFLHVAHHDKFATFPQQLLSLLPDKSDVSICFFLQEWGGLSTNSHIHLNIAYTKRSLFFCWRLCRAGRQLRQAGDYARQAMYPAGDEARPAIAWQAMMPGRRCPGGNYAQPANSPLPAIVPGRSFRLAVTLPAMIMPGWQFRPKIAPGRCMVGDCAKLSTHRHWPLWPDRCVSFGFASS